MPIPISGIDTSQQLPSFDLVSEFEPLQSSLDPSELHPVYSPSDRPGSVGSEAWPALTSGDHYGVTGQPFKAHAPAQSASEKRESVDSSTAETSVRLQPQGESVATPLPSGSRRALRETFRTPSPQVAAPPQEESHPARKYEYSRNDRRHRNPSPELPHGNTRNRESGISPNRPWSSTCSRKGAYLGMVQASSSEHSTCRPTT